MYTTLTAVATGAFALAAGLLIGLLAAIKLGIALAPLLRRDTLQGDPDSSGCWIDQDDHEVLGRLMAAAAKAHNCTLAGFELTPQDHKALGDALIEAEDRFYDCLEGPFLQDLDAQAAPETEPAGL